MWVGLHGRLRGLRLALRARLAAEGLAWLVLAAVAGVFVTLAFDYGLRLDDPLQRGLVVAVAAAALAATLWRQLTRPLLSRMRADDLALLVERRYPHLSDRLISAIQFARRPGDEGVSAAMVARMTDEAGDMVRSLRFGAVVEARRLARMCALAACAVIALTGFSVWQGDVMSLWFRRNVLFADAAWPQRTYLRLQVYGGEDLAAPLPGPDYDVLRGQDLRIVVMPVEGTEAPDEVSLHVGLASLGRTSVKLLTRPADGAARYQTVVRGINEPFTFYVTGGDDRTDARRPHRVRVIEPPALRRVEFTIEYPAYTALPPRSYRGTGEAVAVPFGGVVHVSAEANKPLAAARALLDGATLFDSKRQTPGAELTLDGRRLEARFALPGENEPGGRTLRFALRDGEGHTDRGGQVFPIQVVPDEPPRADAAKDGGLPDLWTLTPRAALPLRVSVRDDYGIGERSTEGGARPAVEIVVSRGADVVFADPAFEPVASGRGRPLRLDRRCELRLSRRVEAGDKIQVFLRAADARPKALDGPGVSDSRKLEFAVVKAEELREELMRRQRLASEKLAQAQNTQATAYAKTDAAAASQPLQAGVLTAAAREGVLGSARAQRAVGDECTRARDLFEAVRQEMVQNGIGDANEQTAMRVGIIEPLGRLSTRCTEVASSLSALPGEASDEGTADLPTRLARLADEQRAILEEMRAIVRRMEKLRSLQAMAEKVQRLVGWLEELQEEIERHRAAGIGEVFQPTTGPATEPE